MQALQDTLFKRELLIIVYKDYNLIVLALQSVDPMSNFTYHADHHPLNSSP